MGIELPKYLSNKKEVIIYDGNTIINQSTIKNTRNKYTLQNNSKIYFVLKNPDESQQITINVKANSDSELFLVVESTRSTKLNMNIKLGKNSNLMLLSAFTSKRKTKLDVNRQFNLASKAKLELMNALFFKGETIMNDNISLEGEEAEVNIDLLNVGSGVESYKIFQDVKHKAKRTRSNINNSLISNNDSRLNYSVSGRIFKGNEKSVCSQINRGVILKQKGIISVEPKLFIDEYDVEANHGAAIGQIDDDQLFYLLSRGLTELEARSLIISGFTNPFIMKIKDEDIQKHLVRIINRKINKENS